MTETHSNPDHLRLSEVYAALAGRVNTEIEAYWARNNLLLAVNIAIFTVALAASGLQRLEHLVLAVIGNATTLLWLLVAFRGRRWLYFWEDRLADVEKSMPPPHVFPGHWKERSWRVTGGEPRSVTGLVFLLPVILLFAWAGYLALRFVKQ